jgi:hypothetical protein
MILPFVSLAITHIAQDHNRAIKCPNFFSSLLLSYSALLLIRPKREKEQLKGNEESPIEKLIYVSVKWSTVWGFTTTRVEHKDREARANKRKVECAII